MLVVLAQTRLPVAVGWAALDGVRHAAAAAFLVVWLTPRWGWVPVVAAAAAAVLLDLDHAVAARSLDPVRMLSLGVRPPTHSLLFATVAAAIVWLAIGRATGVAVGMALSVHLFEDALDVPGVPLLYPFSDDRHIVIPAALAAALTLAVFLLGWGLARPHQTKQAAVTGPSRPGRQ